jgi:hypothetical protein
MKSYIDGDVMFKRKRANSWPAIKVKKSVRVKRVNWPAIRPRKSFRVARESLNRKARVESIKTKIERIDNTIKSTWSTEDRMRDERRGLESMRGIQQQINWLFKEREHAAEDLRILENPVKLSFGERLLLGKNKIQQAKRIERIAGKVRKRADKIGKIARVVDEGEYRRELKGSMLELGAQARNLETIAKYMKQVGELEKMRAAPSKHAK